jgi:hypothetical protein
MKKVRIIPTGPLIDKEVKAIFGSKLLEKEDAVKQDPNLLEEIYVKDYDDERVKVPRITTVEDPSHKWDAFYFYIVPGKTAKYILDNRKGNPVTVYYPRGLAFVYYPFDKELEIWCYHEDLYNDTLLLADRFEKIFPNINIEILPVWHTEYLERKESDQICQNQQQNQQSYVVSAVPEETKLNWTTVLLIFTLLLLGIILIIKR